MAFRIKHLEISNKFLQYIFIEYDERNNINTTSNVEKLVVIEKLPDQKNRHLMDL